MLGKGTGKWEGVPAKLQKGRPREKGEIHSPWLHTYLPVLAHGCMWGASLCRPHRFP